MPCLVLCHLGLLGLTLAYGGIDLPHKTLYWIVLLKHFIQTLASNYCVADLVHHHLL